MIGQRCELAADAYGDKKKEDYLISFFVATRDTSMAYFDVLEKIKKKIFVVKEKIPSKKNKKRK